MTNGIAQVVIGIALAAAIGGVAALNPGNKPHEDVAYLERLAATVERAKSWRRIPASNCPNSPIDTRPCCRTPSLTSSDKRRWGG
jgi:hypothetical protein